MERLIIIGNGFDKAHGLQTSYHDFKKYIKMKDWEFYKAISRYIPEEDLWSDFERALGELDSYQIQENNSSFYIDYGDGNWSDSANYDFQHMIQRELMFATNIPYYFAEWIRTIDTHVRPVVSHTNINKQCIFMNFNYTDTLEHTYNIPSENILYIHGKALKDEQLIVGHHNISSLQEDAVLAFNAPEEYGRYMQIEEEDFRITEAREIIKNYFIETYKDTKNIIEKNRNFFGSLSDINEIFVLGHSLSDIDMDYFEELWKCVSPKCRWYISYFKEADLINIEDFASLFKIDVQAVKIEEL